jgi:cobalt-zinc-cadmium efflux system membrane fusion protein
MVKRSHGIEKMSGAALFLIVNLSLGTWAACSRAPDPAVTSPPPKGEAWLSPERLGAAGIVISTVDEQDLGHAVVTGGRVTFDDSRVTHVFAPVNGRVIRVLAQPGQWVERGGALLAMASPDIGQAFADFVKAKADFSAARSEFQRQKELFESHAGAGRDLEAAEDNFRKAQAERERAQEKVSLLAPGSDAQVTQEYLLRAPISGEIIGRNVNPGTEVQGQYSGGTAVELYTIGELNRVWILADVYEVDLPKIERGAQMTAKLVSYPDKIFHGTVDWVSDALDPVSRTAKVRCSVPNPGKELRPEMYATVSIALGVSRVLGVPRSAILRLGDRTVVFVHKGQTATGLLRFELRNVTVPDGADDPVPVTGGLVAGEKVVTAGAIFLAGMI